MAARHLDTIGPRWTVLALGLVLACGNDRRAETGATGTLSVALPLLVAGAVIAELSWVVFDPAVRRSGRVPLPDTGRDIRWFVGVLPASPDYRIEVEAVSVNGLVRCAGAAPFAILPGETTALTLTVNCRRSDQTGGARVNATLNNCPVVTAMRVAPLQTGMLSPIDLEATASDPDGQPVSLGWYSWEGRVEASWTPRTRFRCTMPGTSRVYLRVTDLACYPDDVAVAVRCLAERESGCGDGRIDIGEQCDDGNLREGDGCSSTCRLPGTCGGVPPAPTYPCGPEHPVGSAADVRALLPVSWPTRGPHAVTPELVATQRFTVRRRELVEPNNCGPFVCPPPSLSAQGIAGVEQLRDPEQFLQVEANARFRLRMDMDTTDIPDYFFPRLTVIPPCSQPCVEGQQRCPYNSACLNEWEMCPRCFGYSDACCACTSPTGASPDGQRCDYGSYPFPRSGICRAGRCE